MKKIKTFEAACKITGDDPKKKYSPSDKIKIIVKAIVGDWKADYSDSSQRKWFPYFIYDNKLGAFRFHVACYDFSNALAGAGARLACETEEQAIYLGETFIDLFNEELLVQ